jgi:cytochrome c oxidase subunit 1
MLFILGFISMFIIGGLSGVMHASPPVDSQQQDSYFVVAHFHYVLFGGSIFALFGGIYYWFPKISGKMFNEALAKIHFVLMFIGFNAVFLPMHWLGMEGMPRRIYTYQEDTGWGWWNMFISLGLFILVLGFVVFIINMLMSLVAGDEAPMDPWDGATLEWSIPSPPPSYNFARIPTVSSRIPLWTEKYPDVYGGDEHGHGITTGEGPEHEREHYVSGSSGETERNFAPDPNVPDEAIHLPNPSIWPMVAALGISIGFVGLMIGWPIMIIGALIGFIGVYGWALQPAIGHAVPDSHGDETPIAAGRSAH